MDEEVRGVMQFLRNTWYLVAWSGDLKPGDMLARTVLERPLLLIRDAEGAVSALDDRCPHRFAPLSRGRFDGSTIACGYHGLEFDTGGACVRNPHGDGSVPAAATVRAHTVVERHGGIWWWAGDRAPDERLLPDFGNLDAEDANTRRDHLVMDAPFDLIVDNLLDCSHTSFLHDGILGNAEMLGVRTTVRQDGDTINVVREAGPVPPPGMFDMLFRADGEPVDTWTDFRWNPPSHLLLDVGVTEPGRPRDEGAGYLGTHILTPETATSTHYFTTASRWGIRPGTETEQVRVQISDMRRFAFEEQDEPMVRAQHATIEAFTRADGDLPRPLMLETDAGVVRWHRIMDRLLDADTAPQDRVDATPATAGRGFVTAEVVEITDEAVGVRGLRLRRRDGGSWPAAEPGSHVDLRLPGGLVRQYSLTDDAATGTYALAVQREPHSRGGSAAVHALAVGDTVEVAGPRNDFPLRPASRHLLVAGGIGITPILAMLRRLHATGADVELHYFARSAERAAFHDLLTTGPLAAHTRTHLGLDPAGTTAVLDDLLGRPGDDERVHVCGPAGLIDAVHAAARRHGRPPGSVHDERFVAEPAVPAGATGFDVVLARSGATVTVGTDESVLDALDRAGIDADRSCEQGVCGTCVTGVLNGEIEHRDSYLTPEERRAGDRMALCVSRCAGPELHLDL
ncbi:Rieske 2Fe-2S domain-containing protein [Pseudonocardia sp. ICBG1122]|nr:Rieske 2Fe-2S domain-containing protein [Pseudonocardia pini]